MPNLLGGLKLAALISLGAVLSLLFMNFSGNATGKKLNPEKTKVNQAFYNSKSTSPHGKGPISVEIFKKSRANIGAVSFIGQVTAKRDLRNIETKWVLPKGVRILSGSPQQTFSQAKTYVPLQTEITILVEKPEDLNVFLSAYQVRKSTRIGTTQTYVPEINSTQEERQKFHLKSLHPEGEEIKVIY